MMPQTEPQRHINVHRHVNVKTPINFASGLKNKPTTFKGQSCSHKILNRQRSLSIVINIK